MMQLPLLVPESAWTPPQSFPSYKGRKRLAIDVETKDEDLSEKGPGCRRPGNYITGITVATDDEALYFPMRHEGGGNMDPKAVLRWLAYEMKHFNGDVYGANFNYDLDWLIQEGVEFQQVKNFIDVQIVEAILDENRLQYSLDSIAKTRVGRGKNETLLRSAANVYKIDPKKSMWRLPAKFVGPYAEDDGRLPLEIFDVQSKLIAEQELSNILFDVELPLIPMLVAMRRRGVKVDLDKAERASKELLALEKLEAQRLTTMAGRPVDAHDSESLAKACDALEILYPRTDKKQLPSFNKDWMQDHENTFIKQVTRVRKVRTWRTRFIEGDILGKQINGRIHCEFHQTKNDRDAGTIARFSSTNPNLQAQPSRDEESKKVVRGVFVPDDDEDWEQCDWSQIEYRALTHYAVGPGSDDARRQYQEDPTTDFHDMCHRMAMEVDARMKEHNRKRIKNVNFGVTYGAGDAKTAQTLGMALHDAQAFLEAYDAALPFVKRTYREAESLAQNRGYIKTILGRRQRFDLWAPRRGYAIPYTYERAVKEYGQSVVRQGCYKALNRLLQGGAADIMKKAMVMIWRSGVCKVLGPPLLTVHDELDWSKPRTPEGETAIKEVLHIMETAVKMKVPLYVDRASGLNWGECD